MKITQELPFRLRIFLWNKFDTFIAFHLFLFIVGNPCVLCPRFWVSKGEIERGPSLIDFKLVFNILFGANGGKQNM